MPPNLKSAARRWRPRDAGMGPARLCASVQRDDPAGRRRLRFRFHARRGDAVSQANERASRHFPLLVNFFTATRNSSVCMQSMMASRSASSCCSIGVTWARWISALVAASAAGAVLRQALRQFVGRSFQFGRRHDLGDQTPVIGLRRGKAVFGEIDLQRAPRTDARDHARRCRRRPARRRAWHRPA